MDTILIQETVRRSNSLECSRCKKKLPKGTRVIFELTPDHEFKGVYCTTHRDIVDELVLQDDEGHPFDLE